ncbi:MAG TPA: CapA family protein [Paludibacter sp.]|nr:CapA family protein [Paludibacter sp.]
MGDLMPDRGIRNEIEKKGTAVLFRGLPYALETVDFTVANLECAVCDSGITKVDKRFAFRATPKWLPGFRKHGVNIVSLANNHSADCGEDGLLQTLAFAKHSGIYTVGANSDSTLVGTPLVISRGKTRVALFSSSFLKSGSKYICHALAKKLEKRIRNYKANYPHTIVVLLLHWGIEGMANPTSGQVQDAHLLVDAGVDVLVGTHPHVVQPIERYKNSLIFYSLGNFIFDNSLPPRNKGMMARLEIRQGQVVDMDTATFNIYSRHGH